MGERGCRVEVENILANQRLGPPSLISDRPQKPTNLVEYVEFLLPVTFRYNKFRSGVAGEE